MREINHHYNRMQLANSNRSKHFRTNISLHTYHPKRSAIIATSESIHTFIIVATLQLVHRNDKQVVFQPISTTEMRKKSILNFMCLKI